MKAFFQKLCTGWGLFVVFSLFSCMITWPLTLNITTSLPQGTEISGTVPLFNLWTLKWNQNRFAYFYKDYWQAPIFYPTKSTFALSDPQPLTGLVFTALCALTGNDILSYNTIILLVLTLNGFGGMVMLLTTGISRGPALLAGLLAMGMPYIGNELGVLQLTMLFPVFFVISALMRFRKTQTVRQALITGWWSAALLLLSNYYAVYLSVFVVLWGAFFMQKRLLSRQALRNLLCGGLLSGLLVLPVIPAELATSWKYPRSAKSVKKTSAEPIDYVRLHRNTLGHRIEFWLPKTGGSKHYLYPGSVLIALALAGVLFRRSARLETRWVLYCTACITLAFVLSLGLKMSIGGWQPYGFFRDYWPGFHQLRNSHRFAGFMQIYLIALAGGGLMVLWNFRARWGPLLAAALVTIGLLEVLCMPLRLYRVPDNVTEAAWIEGLTKLSHGPVAMYPFPARGRSKLYEPIVIGMLQGLEHGMPLINGYSGIFPQRYRYLRKRMKEGLTAANVRLLKETGARYVVVDSGCMNGAMPRLISRLQDNGLLTYCFGDKEKYIYEINYNP